jgi:hypothetical protein
MKKKGAGKKPKKALAWETVSQLLRRRAQKRSVDMMASRIHESRAQETLVSK